MSGAADRGPTARRLAAGGQARWARPALVAVALVWLGMLLGVSFLATPAKFLAPTLGLRAALDVGRHTFGIFSPIEIAAAAGTLVLAFVSRAGGFARPAAVAAAVLVAAQAIWLLPALDARVGAILSGTTPGPAALHPLYIAIDLVKLGLLLVIAWGAAKTRHAPR